MQEEEQQEAKQPLFTTPATSALPPSPRELARAAPPGDAQTPRGVAVLYELSEGPFEFLYEQPEEESGDNWCGGGGVAVSSFASDLAPPGTPCACHVHVLCMPHACAYACPVRALCVLCAHPIYHMVPGAQSMRLGGRASAAAATLTSGAVLSGLQCTLSGGSQGGLTPRQRANAATQRPDCGAATELRALQRELAAAQQAAELAVQQAVGPSAGLRPGVPPPVRYPERVPPPIRGASASGSTSDSSAPYGARARPHTVQGGGVGLRGRQASIKAESHGEPWLELVGSKGGAGLNFTSRAEAEVREALLTRLRVGTTAGSQTARSAGAGLQGVQPGSQTARSAGLRGKTPQVSIFCDGAALRPWIHDHVTAAAAPLISARPSTALSSATWAELLAARDRGSKQSPRGGGPNASANANTNPRPTSPPPRASTALPSPRASTAVPSARGSPRVAARPPPPPSPAVLPPRPCTVPAMGSASMGGKEVRSRGVGALQALPATPRARTAIAGSRHKQPLGSWAAAPPGAEAEAAYMPYGLPHENTVRLSVSGFM